MTLSKATSLNKDKQFEKDNMDLKLENANELTMTGGYKNSKNIKTQTMYVAGGGVAIETER